MRQQRMIAVGSAILAALAGGIWTLAATGSAPEEESERKVTQAEVPKAAMDVLKALAATAPITEIAEEIEHGHKFYEGSWTGSGGNVDALVTDTGDLVEIEVIVSAEKVPLKVRAAVQREASKDAKIVFEKKTMVLYEVHFKAAGKAHEMVLTPDGRRYYEEGERHSDKDEDYHEEDSDD